MTSPADESTNPAPRSLPPHSVPGGIVRPSKEHLLAAFIMFLICLIFTGYEPRWFFWVPLLPLLFALWVLRTRTVITQKGIEAFYLLRKTAFCSWQDFEAIRFGRNGRGVLLRKDETTFPLPGVSFNSLPTLHTMSGGMIPDPVTPGLEAADSKVEIINKDGYAILVDREEAERIYAERAKSSQSTTESTTESTEHS